jgi:hypothetical protein
MEVCMLTATVPLLPAFVCLCLLSSPAVLLLTIPLTLAARGALLGIGATVLGVLLGGAPEYLAGTIKMPAVLTEPGLLVSPASFSRRFRAMAVSWPCFDFQFDFRFDFSFDLQ